MGGLCVAGSASLQDRVKGQVMAWIYFMAVSRLQSSPCTRLLGSWEAGGHLCFSPLQFLFLLLFLPRIKGWWVSHHYVSTFLSGVMLTW